MISHSFSVSAICILGWSIINSVSAMAQPHNPNDGLVGLQEFSKGDSAASGLTNFGLSLFGQNPDQARTAAAAEGLKLLARLMEQNGYDRQRAWAVFIQSPDGLRIIRVPGALSLLSDWFNAVMAPPSRSGVRSDPTKIQHSSKPTSRNDREDKQSPDQANGWVTGHLTAPFLGPFRPNTHGPGLNSDARGRPFVWETDQSGSDPLAKVRPDVFGPGIGMDQYGRPVHAACPPFQPSC